jgi:hemolysin activation/secretion protein
MPLRLPPFDCLFELGAGVQRSAVRTTWIWSAVALSLTYSCVLFGQTLPGVSVVPNAARASALKPGFEERRAQPVAPPEVSDFDVPPVSDRPLDVDGGETILVSRFSLRGAQDRPEFAVTLSNVQSLLDSKLAERPDGFTLGRLQEVADELTRFYREHGMVLAQAFVPVQEVTDGVVEIEVMEGLLGRVVVEGNDLYSASILEGPFRPLLGQPVSKEAVESALLRIADYPGQSSFGVFQPGVEVGTADMVLKVQEEQRFEAALRFDNHGISETGQNRYLGAVSWNNPLKQADKLTATVQQTEVPDNTFFYAFDYEIPITGMLDSNFSVGFSRNQFDVGGELREADIYSDVRNYYLALNKDIIRSRLMNLNVGMRFSKTRSGTKIAGRKLTLDSLSVAALEVNFDNVDARFGGLNAAYLEISHGFNDLFGAMGANPAVVPPSRQSPTGEYAQGKFDKVFLSLSRFQALSPVWEKLVNHNLLFSFEVMWSPDLLVPIEQYAVGGPTNVRGYRSTEVLFDRAIFGSVEWFINAPFIADQPAFGNRTWGELIQLSFFYDQAFGQLNTALDIEKQSENLRSAGFAISFNNPDVFSMKVSIAQPLSRPLPENGKEPQYWIDLNIFF